jgi:hypothetical protein
MLTILVGAEKLPITISEDQTFIAEDLCAYVGRRVGITPRCKLLFGLREVKPNGEPGLWLAPNRRVTCEPGDPPVRLLLSVRFRAPVHRLDATTLNLLVGQIRQYHLTNTTEGVGSNNEALGLTVLDMYREMKEKDLPYNAIIEDYKKYTPERIRRKHHMFVKNPVGVELKAMEEKRVSTDSVKLTYLDAAFRLYPRCISEEYPADVEEAGQRSSCLVRVNPYDPEFPGLAFAPKGKHEVRL